MTCVENKWLLSFVLIGALLAGDMARADEMQFSEEELPREAVMPRLDTPKAVLNRKLSYDKKWSADLTYGWLLDEPFYNNNYIGVQAAYGWNESSGAGLKILSFGSGLSDYSRQFQSSVPSNPPNFAQAKGPGSGFIAFYERRMMYGKLSVTKFTVIPALITWGIEGGMLSYGSKQLPLLGGGLGNRFFLTKHFGVQLGMHAYMRQLVDPLSQKLNTTQAEGNFKTSTKLSTALDLSVSYLF